MSIRNKKKKKTITDCSDWLGDRELILIWCVWFVSIISFSFSSVLFDIVQKSTNCFADILKESREQNVENYTNFEFRLFVILNDITCSKAKRARGITKNWNQKNIYYRSLLLLLFVAVSRFRVFSFQFFPFFFSIQSSEHLFVGLFSPIYCFFCFLRYENRQKLAHKNTSKMKCIRTSFKKIVFFFFISSSNKCQIEQFPVNLTNRGSSTLNLLLLNSNRATSVLIYLFQNWKKYRIWYLCHLWKSIQCLR